MAQTNEFAPIEWYCDYANGSDITGDGTVGNPFKTFQHILSTQTKSTTVGDRINLRDNAVHLLEGPIDHTLWPNATHASPLVIQGYTSVAADGGMAQVDCQGANGLNFSAYDFAHFADLDVFNSGSSRLLYTRSWCSAVNCKFHGCTSNGVMGTNFMRVIGCHVYDVASSAISAGNYATIDSCFVTNQGPTLWVIGAYAPSGAVTNNIFYGTGGDNAISSSTLGLIYASNNTIIFMAAAAGGAFSVPATVGSAFAAKNNVIVNAGRIFNSGSGQSVGSMYANNTEFGTNLASVGFRWNLDLDNEEILTDPIARVGDPLSWDDRFTYYAPVNVGNVFNGGYPNGSNMFRGAIRPPSIFVIED